MIGFFDREVFQTNVGSAVQGYTKWKSWLQINPSTTNNAFDVTNASSCSGYTLQCLYL